MKFKFKFFNPPIIIAQQYTKYMKMHKQSWIRRENEEKMRYYHSELDTSSISYEDGYRKAKSDAITEEMYHTRHLMKEIERVKGYFGRILVENRGLFVSSVSVLCVSKRERGN